MIPSDSLPPRTQAEWHAFAADLNARMALLQIHVEPNWHYAVCTQCGFDLELDRSERIRFRYEVASHRCQAPEPLSLQESLTPAAEPLEMLF